MKNEPKMFKFSPSEHNTILLIEDDLIEIRKKLTRATRVLNSAVEVLIGDIPWGNDNLPLEHKAFLETKETFFVERTNNNLDGLSVLVSRLEELGEALR